jgi:UDP-3-O-[3-hydroxymyristoyl] glucosamine N-acyltransferase
MSKGLSVEEIAKKLSCKFIGENKQIKGVSTLKNATPDHISFFSNNKYRKFLSDTNAGACLIKSSDIDTTPERVTKIICDDPYLAYAYVLDMFYPDEVVVGEISETAYIAKTAKIGQNCKIQHNAFIDENAIIGDNVVVGPSTYIGKGVIVGNEAVISSNVSLVECEIGEKCIIHTGVKIGQDGFGFTLDTQKQIKKIKQVGKVIIGKNVEIGANTCIDRGALENTIVDDNTKIDNLVQIGHNVVIGKNCFICGQAGIAGSTIIGDYVMIGGQAGVSGHIEVGDMVQIASKGGVINDLKMGEKVGGYPAINIIDWHKQSIFLKNSIKNKT